MGSTDTYSHISYKEAVTLEAHLVFSIMPPHQGKPVDVLLKAEISFSFFCLIFIQKETWSHAIITLCHKFLSLHIV